ncbi:MAG: helix-hairpin-helix domain-containing protein [Candidatus Omnitrophota bacterium]|nr:helix-hairpin-helix domain-containing protein [Candidatus Omnitrophota bacterium]
MLNLTKQERLVLIFVGLIALLGVGINFYQKKAPSLDIQKIIEQQNFSRKVNLNRAGLQDLAKIPAIGPVLAEAIVDFKFHKGPFKSPEELKLIKGISQTKFNQIRPFLTLD